MSYSLFREYKPCPQVQNQDQQEDEELDEDIDDEDNIIDILPDNYKLLKLVKGGNVNQWLTLLEMMRTMNRWGDDTSISTHLEQVFLSTPFDPITDFQIIFVSWWQLLLQ